MRQELERKIVVRWPTWFDVDGDVRRTRMADGFAHGDGWFPLLWQLCEDLEPEVQQMEKETGTPFRVLQVKEKFGALRFYVAHSNPDVDLIIAAAQQRSLRTCELCGKPGSLRIQWQKTLCDEDFADGRN